MSNQEKAMISNENASGNDENQEFVTIGSVSDDLAVLVEEFINSSGRGGEAGGGGNGAMGAGMLVVENGDEEQEAKIL